MQNIHPDCSVPLPLTDLSSLPQHLRPTEIDRLLERETTTLFDLSRGPLLRLRLLQIEPEEHLLVLTMHHLASDGWSMGVFVKELEVLYPALLSGKSSPLTDMPFQYADYCLWQRAWLERGALAAQLGYWNKQLAGPLPLLDLPCDFPRPPWQTFRGTQFRFVWPSDFLHQLTSFSTHNGVSLFMTLLAGFQALIHRYTGQHDLIVGTAIANRRQPDTEKMVGPLLNLLPLRTSLDGDPTFQQLLQRTRETALDAYSHQDVPFETLVDQMQPERNLSRTPLFQVLMVLQNLSIPSLKLPDLAIEKVDINYNVSKFDLSLYWHEENDTLSGLFEYNSGLFLPERIERFASDLERLLGAAIKEPGLSLSTLPATEARHRFPSSARAAHQSISLPSNALQTSVEPITGTEKTVARIWEQILGLPKIPVHEKFFELGGDSLRIVQVFLELSVAFPNTVSVADLFTHNTIASLSAFIDKTASDQKATCDAVQVYEL